MSRFRVEVYNKSFGFVGLVGDPTSVTVIPKDWAPGLSTVAMSADHRMVPHLLQPGARMWIRDPDVSENDGHLMSGWVSTFRVSGPEKRSRVEFDIIDDLVIIQRILGWVIPDQDITNQGTAGTNWTMQGPAEDVILTALQENGVNRMGLPIDIPTSQGRGTTVSARLRFQTLFDRLVPVEDGAGIINSGISLGVQQNPDAPGLKVNVWEPTTHTKILNERSGVVTDWSLSGRSATVSRVVVGGQGEGQLRILRETIDAALEASLGWGFETFRDARDTDDPNVLAERAAETLAEGAATSGMNVSLSETANFIARPGKIWVGDTVNMQLAGQTITERLQEVTLSWTASGGRVTRPRIGDWSDNPDVKLAKIVRNIARGIRIGNADT